MSATETALNEILKTIQSEPDKEKRKRLADYCLDEFAKIHADIFSDDSRRLKNEYQRNWRAQNKEKLKTYNRRYWAKKAGRR